MAAQAHPPIGLTFAANNWQAWAIGIEDVGREIEGSPFNQLLAAIKAIERPAPASHPYSTARKNFTYDRTLKMWIQTDQFGRHNTIGLEEFLEDPLIQPLVEDPSIVYGINYMNKRRGGQRIEEADAFEAVANYDPENKPPSARPGAWTVAPYSPGARSPASNSASAPAAVDSASASPSSASDGLSASTGPARPAKRARATCVTPCARTVPRVLC